MPKGFLGLTTDDSKQWLDLPAWRDTYGWDKHGAMDNAQIELDPDRLELTMSSSQPLPKVNVVDDLDSDILGEATGETRHPGPLADPSARHTWHIDPRLAN